MEETNCPMRSKKIVLFILTFVLVILAVYLAALSRNALKSYYYIGKSPEFQDRVTIIGEGRATAVPDVAVINVGVLADRATVAQAQKESTGKINNIVSSLKDFKIDEKDIKTAGYQVSPKYNWSDGNQRIIGYIVSQSVEVKLRDFDKIGSVLAKATELGANQVSGPSFTIDDPEKYRVEAREKAIVQAREKAETLAKQVGINLGSIVGFSESDGSNYPVYGSDAAYGIGGSMEKSLPAPDIQAGSQEVNVIVTISYEIR